MNLEGDREKQTALGKIWTKVFELDSDQRREFEAEKLPSNGAGGWSQKEERVGGHSLKAERIGVSYIQL